MAGRLSQVPVEVLTEPTTQKARFSQLVVEALIFVSPAPKARLSQVPVEVLTEPTTQKTRFSQLVVEALIGPPIPISSGESNIVTIFHGFRNNV